MFENATSCSFQGSGELNKRTPSHHHHHHHYPPPLPQPTRSPSGLPLMGAALSSCGASHVQVKMEECATPDWLGCAYRYGVTQLSNCGVLAAAFGGKQVNAADHIKTPAASSSSSSSPTPNRYLSSSAFTNVPFPPPLSPFHPSNAATAQRASASTTPAPSSNSTTAHALTADPSSSNRHASAETHQGQNDRRNTVPTDPSLWSPGHVKLWLQWAAREFRLAAVDLSRLTLGGKELCRLNQDEFIRLVTDDDPYTGQVLFMHLSYLRQMSSESLLSTSTREKSGNQSHSGGGLKCSYSHLSSSSDPLRLSKTEPSYKSAWGSHSSTQSQGFPHNTIHGMSKPTLDAHAHTHLRQDPYQMFGPTSSRLASSGSGQIQLWQFLLELLSDSSNANCITWEGTNGEFKLTDPDEVARRWGERKSKPNMNYDKLSRALRYYYDKNIMTKVHGKRYAYKFDFQGLAAATQPAAADPTAYKYQSDLFMSASYHTSPKLNFAHAAIPTSSGGIFPSPTSYWTNPSANLYSNIAAASGHGMSHHPSHVTPHIGSYPHYA